MELYDKIYNWDIEKTNGLLQKMREDLFTLDKLMQTVSSNQKEMKEIETQDFFSKKNNYIQTLNQANRYITSINDGMREIKEQQELRKEDQKNI